MIQEYEELQIELERLRQKRTVAVKRVNENKQNYQQAKASLEKERADVEELEGQSLSTFIQNLFGTHEEKLAKEKQEELTAKVELDKATRLFLDAKDVVTVLEEEIEKRQFQRVSLRDQLKATDEDFNRQITEQEKKRLTLKQEIKEYDEVTQAGETVLTELNNVLNELDSADSMATWDMFSDSFFIDMMKYNKIDQAEKELARLEKSLDRYQLELKDVDFQTALAYEELSQMSRAFDIFFDNIFSEWNIKDTIQRNITMLEEMMVEVDDIQELLFDQKDELKKEIQAIDHRL